MYEFIPEVNEPRVQSRSRIQSQDQNRVGQGLTLENFRIPKIYYFDLDSLPDEKIEQMRKNPSDFFNYGRFHGYDLGFTENTWRLYAQFITNNEEIFKRICEEEIITPNNLTGDHKGIFHQNAELNFCLPMDMGGLGHLFNRDRYSRVHFWDKSTTPVLKMKQSYNECFMSLEKTAKAYDRNCPTPSPPENPPESFVPIYGHYLPMIVPTAQMYPPMPSIVPPTRKTDDSSYRDRRPDRSSSRSKDRSRSRHRSKHHHHRRSRDKYDEKRHSKHHKSKHSHRK